MRRVLVVLAACLLPMVMFAENHGKLIGGEPTLKWEDGGMDFFMMFNSLIDDQKTLYKETDNRQADTCILESSFELTEQYVPIDAIIEKAYLVWMGAVDPTKFDQPTDNQVHLKFTSAFKEFTTPNKTYSYEQDVIVGAAGKLLTDTSSFEFEGMKYTDKVTTGCSETQSGTEKDGEVGYFTYRTDITDIFTKINTDYLPNGGISGTYDKGEKTPANSSNPFYGTWTVSGLDCTDNEIYKCKTTMVSSWAIIFVYRSAYVSSKKIYVYEGLGSVQFTESIAKVSGFELPKNPIVRLTSMIAEGDPKLADPTRPPAEGVFLKGDGASIWYLLTNDCNNLEGMSYEVYNSKSSLYGWNPDINIVSCVTGKQGGPSYFGIDADTFVLNAEEDVNLQEHLALGKKSMDVKLAVNQDAIFTNFLVVSVDTKTPAFDIPPEYSTTLFPDGKEKSSCSCQADEVKNPSWCEDRPMYYIIKVQNWGTNVAKNVMVSDELSSDLEYIPGSTEMNQRVDGVVKGYTKIADKAGGISPLTGEGIKVADQMDICNLADGVANEDRCSDWVEVRFLVKPKTGTPKHAKIPNTAVIKEQGASEEYKTNSSFPHYLTLGTCKDVSQCAQPSADKCTEMPREDECSETKPCPSEYQECVEGKCVINPDKVCEDSTVDFAAGKNSPVNEGSSIIISVKPDPKEKFIVGQVAFKSDTCVATKAYFLKMFALKVDRFDDSNIQLSNMELVYDKDADGIADSGEPVIATVSQVDQFNQVAFRPETNNVFPGKTLHHFLIRADVSYAAEEIKNDAKFQFSVEGKGSFLFEDRGEVTVKGSEIKFPTYLLEPTTGYFIVTKGDKDPAVPPVKDMNAALMPVLQLRTKATDIVNKINAITVKIPTAAGYEKLGEGITKLALYVDLNKNGLLDAGDTPLGESSDFKDPMSYTFENLATALSYKAGEEKFLLVAADFNFKLEDGKEYKTINDYPKAKLMIQNGGVILQDKTQKPLELPIYSKDYIFECTESWCKESKKDCSCSIVETEGNALSMTLIALGFAALLLALRRRLLQK